MTVKFEMASGVEQIPVRALVYRPQEYSFDMVPPLKGGFTSVLIDDLNMEVDDSGKVISVWGMCPHTRWVDASLVPPAAKVGALFVSSEGQLLRGVSVQVNGTKYLPTYADRRSGWVQIRSSAAPATAIQVFSGVVVEIDEHGQFASLWLQPQKGISLSDAG